MKRWLGIGVALWIGLVVVLAACGRSTEVSNPSLQPLAANNYYLSDLVWESAKNTFGPVEKDSSNGDKFGGDGRTLTINGKTYLKGLGITSPSEIVYNLAGRCSVFSAEVGVDDLWNATRGSVVFQVFADNIKIWDSGLMTYTDTFRATGVLTIAGKQRLKLVTTDGGNGGQDDYADWAIPAVTCDPAPPALAPTDASTKGAFGPLEPWPTIPTHAALLPDSTIISWYSRDTNGVTRSDDYNDQSKHNSTLVDLWRLDNNSHTRRDNPTTDLFCAGFTPIADGRLLVAGGNLGARNNFSPGSIHTNLYSPSGATWTRGPDMTEGRWYPSVINLPNRDVLLMGGTSNETTHFNRVADVWSPSTNTLRRLTGTSTQGRTFNHSYPWIHVAPNGRVFYSGSTSNMAYLTTSGTGSWGSTYTRDSLNRRYGSSVMYEPGKILVLGGGVNTSSNTAVTVDLTNGVQAIATSSMASPRTNPNATILADGSVFVNGGNTSGVNFDDATSVYISEVWNPATGSWQLGATAQKPRNYHAVSLLLPDGRVWTAGGGGCGSCSVNQQNAEIYYPPYLFRKDGSRLLADRPRVTIAPSTLTYNQSYTLYTPDPSSISKAALVGIGSVTHAFNMNQRYVPLTLSNKTSTTLAITSPNNANVAPPGYYLLFIVNSSGVPSVARIIQVQ
jgi:NPCBM/NEW2 domain/Domain of unknown function (DUF1929)/Glyoxal oxidase N-terminus